MVVLVSLHITTNIGFGLKSFFVAGSQGLGGYPRGQTLDNKLLREFNLMTEGLKASQNISELEAKAFQDDLQAFQDQLKELQDKHNKLKELQDKIDKVKASRDQTRSAVMVARRQLLDAKSVSSTNNRQYCYTYR